MDYKKAGVDIEAGYKAVELMKKHVTGNHAPRGTGRNRRLFRSLFPGMPLRIWSIRRCFPEPMVSELN